jgi:hypothetical protein
MVTRAYGAFSILFAVMLLLGLSLVPQAAFAQCGGHPDECDCTEEDCEDSTCDCSAEDSSHSDECDCECHHGQDCDEEEEESGECTGECHSMEPPPPCPEDPEVVGEGE